jgi:hypothetical protein
MGAELHIVNSNRHVFYTSTPARKGWRQGPGDKTYHAVPTEDAHDRPASQYKRLDPAEIEKRENPENDTPAHVEPSKH